MKIHLSLLLIAFFSINSFSQITFEKGYYIDNSNQRIECLIKNIDWKNNPTEFTYKLTETDTPKEITIKSVNEFGINNVSKYVRSIVKIDRSSEKFNEMNNEKEPIFNEEELFLKVLIEGKANLYFYESNDLKRYFYSVENYAIEQLIYKKYKASDYVISSNNSFKQQLWISLKCPSITMKKINSIMYRKNDLIKLFLEYNKCNNSENINYEEKLNKDLFNLTIRPRLNNSSLSIQEDMIPEILGTDFGSKLGFGIGIEAELIMPFNKNKWGIIIEPTYQYFKSNKTKESPYYGGLIIAKVDYKSIELPLGFRHYFFLTDESKIFLDVVYITNFNLSSSSIEFKRSNGAFISSISTADSKNNIAIGLGYKFKDYNIQLRYHSKRDVLGYYNFWDSDYKNISLIFGYTLL